MSKQLYTRIQNKYDTQENWDNHSDFTPLRGELIVIAAVDDDHGPTIKIGDGHSSMSELPNVSGEAILPDPDPDTPEPDPDPDIPDPGPDIPEYIYISKPYIESHELNVEYSGQWQSPSIVNFNSDGMTWTGRRSAINAGEYTIIITLNPEYLWEDGSSLPVELTWRIVKANPDSFLFLKYKDEYIYTSWEFPSRLTTSSASIQVEFPSYIELSNVTIEEFETSYNYLSVEKSIHDAGATLTFSYNSGVSITEDTQLKYKISINETSNHYGTDTLLVINLKPTITIDSNKGLNEYTWEEISIISKAELASSVFSVGEDTTVFIKDPYYGEIPSQVFILDLDRWETDLVTTNGITFGGFTWPEYIMTTLLLKMCNFIGEDWRHSNIRYEILGGTDVKDAYEPSVNCVLTPVANSLMSWFPDELRKVLRPVQRHYMTPSGHEDYCIDYLSIPSYWELTGGNETFGPPPNSFMNQFASYNSEGMRIPTFDCCGYDPELNSDPYSEPLASWWTRDRIPEGVIYYQPSTDSSSGWFTVSVYNEKYGSASSAYGVGIVIFNV